MVNYVPHLGQQNSTGFTPMSSDISSDGEHPTAFAISHRVEYVGFPLIVMDKVFGAIPILSATSLEVNPYLANTFLIFILYLIYCGCKSTKKISILNVESRAK